MALCVVRRRFVFVHNNPTALFAVIGPCHLSRDIWSRVPQQIYRARCCYMRAFLIDMVEVGNAAGYWADAVKTPGRPASYGLQLLHRPGSWSCGPSGIDFPVRQGRFFPILSSLRILARSLVAVSFLFVNAFASFDHGTLQFRP